MLYSKRINLLGSFTFLFKAIFVSSVLLVADLCVISGSFEHASSLTLEHTIEFPSLDAFELFFEVT